MVPVIKADVTPKKSKGGTRFTCGSEVDTSLNFIAKSIIQAYVSENSKLVKGEVNKTKVTNLSITDAFDTEGLDFSEEFSEFLSSLNLSADDFSSNLAVMSKWVAYNNAKNNADKERARASRERTARVKEIKSSLKGDDISEKQKKKLKAEMKSLEELISLEKERSEVSKKARAKGVSDKAKKKLEKKLESLDEKLLSSEYFELLSARDALKIEATLLSEEWRIATFPPKKSDDSSSNGQSPRNISAYAKTATFVNPSYVKKCIVNYVSQARPEVTKARFSETTTWCLTLVVDHILYSSLNSVMGQCIADSYDKKRAKETQSFTVSPSALLEHTSSTFNLDVVCVHDGNMSFSDLLSNLGITFDDEKMLKIVRNLEVVLSSETVRQAILDYSPEVGEAGASDEVGESGDGDDE